MASRILSVLEARRKAKTPAFVGYLTAGFPTEASTVPCLLALQEGGADVIELGLPYSDPTADGTTIQRASEIALEHDMNLTKLFKLVEEAKKQGLKVPIVVMGYYNPLLAYGIEKLAAESARVGVDGYIIVDLAPEEAVPLLDAFSKHNISFIPLVTPVTTDERMKAVAKIASSFVYCVSVTGVTGQRDSVATDLSSVISRLRGFTDLPVLVGFGVSKREHVESIYKAGSDGTIVGSAIVATIEGAGLDAAPEAHARALKEYISLMTANVGHIGDVETVAATQPDGSSFKGSNDPFVFGQFGGRFIPETLVQAHEELAEAWKVARVDKEYLAELARLRKQYTGGPTPLWLCERLTELCGGAKIWLKREDLAHTGAHKINNALGQVLLAKKLGKTRVIAETGAGQHGVATATACALFGIDCTVYMGEEDCQRQSLNVFRMKVLGTKVVAVTAGSRTLKDAINEAMRDWVANVRNTHYCVGSAIGSHPFPGMVRDLQSVLGKEARADMLEQAGCLPDYVVACVGGGSNAIGIFHPFVNDKDVKLVGAEAGGASGVQGGHHSATLVAGTPGVLHGCMTYLLQDEEGQCKETHSISAGLDYPGVGPEHSHLKDTGRAEYVCVTDSQAMEAFHALSEREGIIPALESSHALYAGMELAKKAGKGKHVLVNLSGRGDKDMLTVAKKEGFTITEAL